jgi:hypothetical protein
LRCDVFKCIGLGFEGCAGGWLFMF